MKYRRPRVLFLVLISILTAAISNVEARPEEEEALLRIQQQEEAEEEERQLLKKHVEADETRGQDDEGVEVEASQGLFSAISSYFKYDTCTWFYRQNPADCGTFYQCNFGQALIRDCPPGLFWNDAVTTCDWPRNVRGIGTSCTDTREGQGQAVNPQTETDTVIIQGEDEDGIRSQVPSSSCKDGEFRPNTKDCGAYFLCNHGALLHQACPAGLNWNNDRKICDWPANAKCSASAVTTSTTTVAPPSPRPPPAPTTGTTTTTTTAAAAPLAPTAPGYPSNPSSDYKVICYFTDWAWYRPGLGKYSPSNIDAGLCTHIIYAFALLSKWDFTIKTADSWADIDNKFYEQVTSLKKRGVKVSIALGGWNDSEGDGYSRLVNSKENRAKFISSAVEFVNKYNFDGIDLDWEYPACPQGDCSRGVASDKGAFAAFVTELRAALPAGALLSAAVSASKVIISAAYDVPTISHHLDWIGVMDYDFHGSWEHKTGHIAPLFYSPGDDFDYFNVNSSINFWLANGAPANKLIVGIPLYGQAFTLADDKQTGLNAPSTGPGTAGQFTRQAGVLAYYEICGQSWDRIVQNPEGAMGPYAYKGRQWVSYDDAAFVKVKADFVRRNRLGGAMVWALDFDDFKDTCGQGAYPLLTAIANRLK